MAEEIRIVPEEPEDLVDFDWGLFGERFSEFACEIPTRVLISMLGDIYAQLESRLDLNGKVREAI
jgi:hypothetical protein